MTVYFKATRPTDPATDFHTGLVKYEVGKRVRPLPLEPGEERGRICGPGLLHAADVPAETLVGGSWPCRLFEVTGTPVTGFDSDHPHKGGFKQLTVVREIDAHLALGPNGREVAAVIERARRLTLGEARQLAAAWTDARAAAWTVARDAAGDAAWAAARAAAWAAARAAAGDAARAAAGDAAGDAAGAAAGAAAGDAAGAAAWDAAWAAAGAVVVRDLITPEQFDLLYGPWAKVMEAA